MKIFVFGALSGSFIAFLILGMLTDGFNAHPQEVYIVSHRCIFSDHFYEPPYTVVVDGNEVKGKANSWDACNCPNGQIVTIEQNPATR